jgi:threonylcarbamoyladenosine tRNA methylthiotransferase MtaB
VIITRRETQAASLTRIFKAHAFMQVHLKALGCRLNEAELETWARDFRDRGMRVVNTAGDADLVVVNTCAVTEEAVRKSRKLLRRVHRDNPQAKLVLSGCLPSLGSDDAEPPPGVDLVVDNRRKDRLPQIVMDALQLHAAPAAASEPGENLLFARGRQRAFIKVQDGCRYRCTYCVVTLARGEERSRPADEIVTEIERLVAEGISEVVLTGVHLGGYGSDRGASLVELVRIVLENTDVARVRLGSLEPWDIPDTFWDLFSDRRLMPHLHLPMQSGSDTVLRRMARRCRTGEFRRLLAAGRDAVPALNVTTDIIVGFPGETGDEYHDTLEFVREMEFGHVHIFPFSPRAGTKAALLPGAVDGDSVRERSRALHEAAEAGRRRVLHRETGHTREVLVEKIDSDGQAWGYTPNYLRVAIETGAGGVSENMLVTTTITGVHRDGHLSAVMNGRSDPHSSTDPQEQTQP